MHYLRSVSTSYLASWSVPAAVREMILNHVDQSIGGKFYNSYDFINERRAALSDWAAGIAGEPQAGERAAERDDLRLAGRQRSPENRARRCAGILTAHMTEAMGNQVRDHLSLRISDPAFCERLSVPARCNPSAAILSRQSSHFANSQRYIETAFRVVFTALLAWNAAECGASAYDAAADGARLGATLSRGDEQR